METLIKEKKISNKSKVMYVNDGSKDKTWKIICDINKKEKFLKVKEFDMKNRYKILIYERVKEIDKEEIEMYKTELEDLSKKYPELYKNIIEQYEEDMKL